MSVEATQSALKEVHSLSLCDEIERLVRLERTAAWLLCHHCAELADRFDARDPVLVPFGDIYRLAGSRFAMGERAVRERVRVGRALRRLPLVHGEFADGRMSFAKVREVTRVADRDTEEQWLETARTASVRSLERKVAQARRPEAAEPLDALKATPTREPGFVNVELRLPERTWSAVVRAMGVARSKSLRPLTDAEALEAVACWALACAGHVGAKDAAIASCGRVAADRTAEDGELPFAAELRARLADEIAAARRADGAEHDASGVFHADPTEEREKATRPGHEDAPEDEATRPGHTDLEEEEADPARPEDDRLASAPGRFVLSERSVEAARQIVSAIELEATNEEAICQRTGLPAGHVAATMTELMLAGIVVRTHHGLALTQWATRHRFRAARRKTPH